MVEIPLKYLNIRVACFFYIEEHSEYGEYWSK